MPDMKFVRWLRREPKPAKLELADGKRLAFPTVTSAGSKRVKELAEAIEALQSATCTAIDKDGTILRVYNFDVDVDEEDTAAAEKRETTRLADLARIILDATDRGAARHADAYAMAFERLNQVLDIAMQRLGSLENAWIQTITDTADQRVKYADAIISIREEMSVQGGGGDGLDGLVKSVLEGAAAKAMTGGKITNGKVDK